MSYLSLIYPIPHVFGIIYPICPTYMKFLTHISNFHHIIGRIYPISFILQSYSFSCYIFMKNSDFDVTLHIEEWQHWKTQFLKNWRKLHLFESRPPPAGRVSSPHWALIGNGRTTESRSASSSVDFSSSSSSSVDHLLLRGPHFSCETCRPSHKGQRPKTGGLTSPNTQ